MVVCLFLSKIYLNNSPGNTCVTKTTNLNLFASKLTKINWERTEMSLLGWFIALPIVISICSMVTCQNFWLKLSPKEYMSHVLVTTAYHYWTMILMGLYRNLPIYKSCASKTPCSYLKKPVFPNKILNNSLPIYETEIGLIPYHAMNRTWRIQCFRIP